MVLADKILFSLRLLSTPATLPRLAAEREGQKERRCLAETALSADHSINEPHVNARAGRMPHG